MNSYKPLIFVFLAFLGFSLVFHASVQAMPFKKVSQPVAQATMDVNVVDGVFNGVETVELVIKRAITSKFPTSVQMTIDSETIELSIQDISQDECGSIILEATGGFPDAVQIITLRDHSTRNCTLPNVVPWDAQVKLIGFAGTSLGKMELTGSPQSVFSPQVEQL